MDVNWFPGHMAKTLRELKQYIQQVDLVIEICDARLPESSRNPELDRLLGQKQRLLVLNKADLADPAVTDRWLTWYRQQGLAVSAVNSTQRSQTQKLYQQIIRLNQDKIEQAKARGRLNRPIRVLVAGIPNTGKSTLINALCGRKLAKTADQPGVTRQISWIRSGRQLELVDSPGILWPRLGDEVNKRNLAASGAIRDHLLLIDEIALAMFRYLLKAYPRLLGDRYKLISADLEQVEGEAETSRWFAQAAIRRGCLLPGGEPDTERFAALFLDELRSGRIGRISYEKPPA